jgi:hypothetical protein
LVTGERIPTPPAAPGVSGTVPSVQQDQGFPWWVFPVPLTVLGAIFLTRRRFQTDSVVGRKQVVPVGRPWVEMTVRRPGSPQFAAWISRRIDVLGHGSLAWRPDALSFATAKQAKAYVESAQTPGRAKGIFTWTLKGPDGKSLAVSACAYPTVSAARADAQYWSRHADELSWWVVPADKGRTTWWVGKSTIDPVCVQAHPTSDEETIADACAAILGLSQAYLPQMSRQDLRAS